MYLYYKPARPQWICGFRPPADEKKGEMGKVTPIPRANALFPYPTCLSFTMIWASCCRWLRLDTMRLDLTQLRLIWLKYGEQRSVAGCRFTVLLYLLFQSNGDAARASSDTCPRQRYSLEYLPVPLRLLHKA